MNNYRKLISLIIPVKNEADKINIIIEGIHRQSYRPIEVIFVDGGSTDGTIEVIRKIIERYSARDFVIRLFMEEDFGKLRSPANARNIGVINARGRYVCFFDADFDLGSDPEAVDKVVKAFEEGADHVAIKYIPNEHTWIERNLATDDMVYYFNYDKPRHEVCCFVKEVVLRNLFDPMLGFGEDMEFLQRLSRLGLKRVVVDTSVRRCYPHSIKDFLRQQLWYGRTWLRYVRKIGLKNPLLLLARSNALVLLISLTILSLIINYFVTLGFILLLIGFIYYRWLRRDLIYYKSITKIVERFLWLLFREIVGRIAFDLGVVKSLFLPRKLFVGRE